MFDKSEGTSIRQEELFEHSPCLALNELLDYANEKLSADERYRVEKHLLDCELCSLALEKLSGFENREAIPHAVETINSAIRARAAQQSENVQAAQKIYFLTAILAYLQHAVRHRYAKIGAIIFSVLIVAGVSLVSIKLSQNTIDYQIPENGSQVRSTNFNFFADAQKLGLESSPAEHYFAEAAKFAQAAQYDSVIVYLKRASELFASAENWERYVRCCNAIAEYSRVMGDYRQAREYIDRAIRTGINRLGKDHPEVITSFAINGRIPAEP